MNPRLRFSTTILFATLLALALVSCGDDDVSGDGTSPAQPQTTEPGGEGGTDGDVQDAIDELDFGDGEAVVTIGDTTSEFALGGNSTVGNTTYIGVCQTLFGVIAGEGFDPDGADVTLSFEITPENYADQGFDPPSMEIEDNTDGEVRWVADQTLAEGAPELAGMSQIDSWTTDGRVARGTATFIQVEPFGIGPVEGATPVQGTFQLGCAE